MVVLSTSVCTKNGKVLVSRQFVNIPRSRIEGLLAAFPKLLGGSDNQQHTFIETASVRYLYQRFEELFLVVITNKSSNIVEDLETLRILTKVVPEYCGSGLSEKAIIENGFDLIFAFDEVVSLGYKENVTIEQIRTFTELDSHEERIHEMIEKNKEREAHEEAKRRIKEIDNERREREKLGLTQYGGKGGMGSGGMGGGMGSMGALTGSGVGSDRRYGGTGPDLEGGFSPKATYKPEPTPDRKPVRKGLQLKKKPQSQGLIEQIHQEGDTAIMQKDIPATRGATESDVVREAVEISVLEQISCAFDNDGGLRQMQVMGEFLVNITEEAAAQAIITVLTKTDLQFRIHPNINRDLFLQKGVIVLKDTSKSYPLETPTGVLKWRHQTSDENEAPMRVSVWPSVGSGGRMLVNVEYELTPQYELSDVNIVIHIVAKSAPEVSTDQGNYKYDTKNEQLEWNLPFLSSDNPRGSMELNIEQWDNSGDTSWLFPVIVTFNSCTTFCNIKVVSVLQPDGNPIPFSEKKQLNVHQYTVG